MANKELMQIANTALTDSGYTLDPEFHGLKRVFIAPEGSPFAGKRVVAKSTTDGHIAFERRTDMGDQIEWRTLDEGVDFVAVLQEGSSEMTVHDANVVRKAFEMSHTDNVERGNQPVKNKMSMWVDVDMFGKPVDTISVLGTHGGGRVVQTHTVGNVVVQKRESGAFTALVDGKPVAARQHLIRIRDDMGLPSKNHDTTRSLGTQIFDALPPPPPPPAPATAETPGDVMARCKAEIADAFGVDADKIKISFDM